MHPHPKREVLKLATPEPTKVLVPSTVLPSRNVTTPVGAAIEAPLATTLAVKVTLCPTRRRIHARGQHRHRLRLRRRDRQHYHRHGRRSRTQSASHPPNKPLSAHASPQQNQPPHSPDSWRTGPPRSCKSSSPHHKNNRPRRAAPIARGHLCRAIHHLPKVNRQRRSNRQHSRRQEPSSSSWYSTAP